MLCCSWFLSQVGYDRSIFYHNNYHSADVTQVSARILLIPEVYAKLGKKDVLAVLFAAIIHDFRSVRVQQ